MIFIVSNYLTLHFTICYILLLSIFLGLLIRMVQKLYNAVLCASSSNSSFNDVTSNPCVFHSGRKYTAEIGKHYKSVFSLSFCQLSDLSDRKNVNNAGKNSKCVVSEATTL